jgi:pseudaminic acid cytidylyltransferase
MNIAIIPARGGSKRIPRKNIKNFCGQPIIAYSIQAAQKSELFDRIIVSTDDEEIADVSRQYGAETPFMRPKELADDFTGTNAVVGHCLKWLIEKDQKPGYACCIYATAPFLQSQYLKKGFQILKKGDCTFVFSSTSFAFPIQRSIRIKQNGYVEPMFPESIPKRSQDLEEAYHDAGQFYWSSPNGFLDHESSPMTSTYAKTVVLPRHCVQDIDTLEDWELAELMFVAWHPDKGKHLS